MGLCASAEDYNGPKINTAPTEEEKHMHKLLMLGAGESGKSTMFKQLITIYGNGFSKEDREYYTDVILQNVLESMQGMLKYYDELVEQKDSNLKEIKWTEELKESKERILRMSHLVSLGSKLTSEIERFWKEPAIRNMFERRDEFQLMDSAGYFFDKVKTLGTPGYSPSDSDILRCRARTTGVVEGKFIIGGTTFAVVDVGGQRNERKKWIHHFETCQALLFVVSLSAYSQKLFEDNKTNRMIESIELFDQVANSRWFQKTPMVLFLNKTDIFAEKIKKVPLTTCKAFSKFEGDPHSFEETSDYIIGFFEDLDCTGKRLYSHLTCATDKEMVKPIFESMKDSILEDSLNAAGMAF
mmetsp:Transcript_20953/g.31252  ORF Transcript_20953/g.31252 Transcript_20953/m.31252 type:complete len:355 (-) Transcript_20953:239-1303(-)